MKLSLAWLRELVDWPGTAGELAVRLTDAGLPVESVGGRREDLAPIVVGLVTEAGKHPNADRLKVCRVDVGGGEVLSIVCGGPNVAAGQRVAIGRVGTTLPNGITLEARKIRGETSQGMICSGEELACDPTPEGIWVLPENAPVGASLRAALGLDDDVLDIEVPSNRGDALSHVGVAREVAALTGAPLRIPAAYASRSGSAGARDAGGVAITIEDPAGCPAYGAVRIRGVRVAPSPEWLRRRVEAVGIRSLSNVVDATNLVLLECGHPVHAFDLARLAGPEIRVRRARAGEQLVTLDGKECRPSPDVLVIADRDRAVALAGIMGGQESEVSETTTDLLVEVALFDPYAVRAGSRIVKKTSEASLRFGRGVDPEGVSGTLARVAELVLQVAGGERVGEPCVIRAAAQPPRAIAFDPGLPARLLGADVPDEESEGILRRLSCRVERGAGAGGGWTVEPPSYRRDLNEPVDLVEEIARVRGYDTIPEQSAATIRGASRDPAEARERRARAYLADVGFFEARTLTLLDPEEIARLRLWADAAPIWRGRGGAGEPAAVENPLASDQSVLRPSLLAGLLGALRLNRNRGIQDLRLFEIGPVFRREGAGGDWGVGERCALALAWCGAARPPAWDDPARPADLFDMKGVLAAVAETLGAGTLRAEPAAAPHPIGHPGRQGDLLLEGTRIGMIAELHAHVAEAAGLPERTLVAEIDFDALTERAAPTQRHRALPRYPAIRRDVALIVAEEIAEERARALLARAAGDLLESVALFDVYRGAPIPEGSKSLAYAFVFRSPETTLTDAEADRLRDAIVAAASKELGAKIR